MCKGGEGSRGVAAKQTMNTPTTALSAKLAGYSLHDSPNPQSFMVPWLSGFGDHGQALNTKPCGWRAIRDQPIP